MRARNGRNCCKFICPQDIFLRKKAPARFIRERRRGHKVENYRNIATIEWEDWLSEFTISSQYITQMSNMLRDMRVNVPNWLARCGLSEHALEDANLTITYPLFQRLVTEALNASQEPALGLLLGERLRFNAHGILGYGAMSSRTLRDAIELIERFIHVRFTLTSMHHQLTSQTMNLHFNVTRPLGKIQNTSLEAVVLTVRNVLDQITMGSCHVLFASFAIDNPTYTKLARDLFRCEVRYNQSWTGFALPLQALDQPLSMADPETCEEAARVCERKLARYAASASIASQVRRILLEKQGAFPSLPILARLFHLTPRTLHRRLEEEGTSFKAILDEVRHFLALQYLQDGRLSIQEIAFNLGYTDQANFRRAFKRWEKLAPSEYVRQLNSRPR